MTTIGVSLDLEDHEPRLDALRFPSYNYPYPHFKKKQACDCVNSALTPRPPVFRRTSADFLKRDCKCRELENVLPTGKAKRDLDAFHWLCEFADKPTTLPPIAIAALPKPDLLVRPRLTAKEKLHWYEDTTPVVTTEARNEWNGFLNRCPERFDIKLPLEEEPQSGNRPYFDGGYSLRFLRPDLTRGAGLLPIRGRFFGAVPTPSDDSPYRSIRNVTCLIGQ